MRRLAVFTFAIGLLVAVTRAQQPPAAARENAYRANNIGVAWLEQYNFANAAASFRDALRLDPSLAIARLNLGIALFYGGDATAARSELETARA
jgi:lipoprotein NlpI